jgi:hypothetical protein
MLFRPVTRLIDCFIAEKYWIRKLVYVFRPFPKLCESELVVPPDEEFPAGLDFSVFLAGCGLEPLHPIHLTSNYLPHSMQAGLALQDRNLLNGNGQILWLSPCVFVSRVCFMVDGDHAHDYKLELWPRNYNERLWWPRRNICLFVYSLSSFQQRGKSLSPSKVGIDFFRHLLKSLPVDYFDSIVWEWAQSDFPPSLCVSFLSILHSNTTPTHVQQRPQPHPVAIRSKTLLAFRTSLNREQREAVFSPDHDLLSNDNIRVMFRCTLVNSTLAQCQMVRHLALRVDTLLLNDGETPCTANSNIESVLIIAYGESCRLPQFLAGLKQNPAIKHLYISHGGYSRSLVKQIRHLLQILPEHQSLITVNFSGSVQDDSFTWWEQLVPFLDLLGHEIYSINLSHFSIEISHEREKAPHKNFQKWWDTNMAPILVLNWYRNEARQLQLLETAQQPGGRERTGDHVANSVQEPHFSWKVLAVNRGNVYCIVTASVSSSDMTMANASLLFRMVRSLFN